MIESIWIKHTCTQDADQMQLAICDCATCTQGHVIFFFG